MNKEKHLNDFIPNKFSYIILALFAIGFIIYGIFYTYKKKSDIKQDKEFIDVNIPVNKKVDEKFLDSDGDGVYDWVENLWPELDPNNPDSDGDGVLDGKYIKQKQLIRDKERRGATEIKSTLSESEKLGRSVYTALLAIQQSGEELDDITKDQISDNIVNYISDLSIGTKLYIRDDLKKVSDNKENSLKYKKVMESFFKKYPINTSEIKLILDASKEPKKYIVDIEKAAMKYDAYVNELYSVEVPYIIAGRHTELLNAAGQLEGALKNLSMEKYDDIVMLSSIVQTGKTINSITDSISNIKKYFDIISEPGIFE